MCLVTEVACLFLVLLSLSGVVLPASADSHHQKGHNNQHHSVSELIDGNNAKVEFLPILDFYHFFLKLFSLLALLNSLNVLCITTNITQQ